jgi:microcystin-dependent protein
MIIWEVLAFTSSTAIGINNSWSNISSTYGAFTGAQVQGGNANIQINNNGSSVPHNNMPPYLTINWIIRT